MAETSFKFSEQDCIKLILEFLENRDLNISQLSLERETGVINGNFSDDLLFLRQLILDGQWEHVFEFISPLESISTFDRRQVRYILNKYKYIELLCIKFEIGPFQNAENCVKKIVDCLSELEQYCPSKEDYNAFCLLLTLENFDQHSDYRSWNPSKSRIKCFNEVKRHIERFLPIIRRPGVRQPTSAKGDRLLQMIIKGILYDACLEYCQRRATASPTDRVQFEFSDLLEEAKLNRSDSSLLSWLQSIPPDTFAIQFEDKRVNANVEKHEKPSLIANWSEMMLSSPIKPKVFPHNQTPFTRLRATDLMSKSLTSGILDGLSKSIMSFSLKDAADMSHSSIAATREFHLSQQSGGHLNTTSDSPVRMPATTSDAYRTPGKNSDEQMMEKMFEQGNVFNSSCLGKLSTISEDKTPLTSHAVELSNKENLLNRDSSGTIEPSPRRPSNDSNASKIIDDASSIEEMKQQLEQFADAQWKEFLRKKDELMMSSITKATASDMRRTPHRFNESTNLTPHRFNESTNLTPVGQTGQKFVDLQSLITSTPKATPNDDGRLHDLALAADYNPVRLNFSGISADSTSTVVSNDGDYLNQTARLASNQLDLNLSQPKSAGRHFANLSNQFNHPGSNNSSLKSPNISLDSGVVAKSSSSVHLNGNQTNGTTKSGAESDKNGSSQCIKPSPPQQQQKPNKGLFVELTKLEDVQAIRAVEFHPKGKYYAVGSNSKTLRICSYPYASELKKDVELPMQPEVTLRRLKYHKGSIFCLGWNPSGELLATGSNDQTIKLVRFNQDTCELVEETECVLSMHEATVRDLCFMQDSTNNTNLLISGGAGNCKIYVTDCQTATPFQAFSGHSGHVLSLYNWGGAVVVSGSQDRTIRFFDLRSGGCVNLITAPSVTGQGAGGAVSSVTVDPSGRLLVSGHDDASCMLYDIRGQRVIQTFKPHNGDVRSVRFSPKAYYLLSGGYDNNVVLTDLQGDLTQPLTSLIVASHQDKVVQAKWHPHEFNFLSSSADKTAVLWSLPSN